MSSDQEPGWRGPPLKNHRQNFGGVSSRVVLYAFGGVSSRLVLYPREETPIKSIPTGGFSISKSRTRRKRIIPHVKKHPSIMTVLKSFDFNAAYCVRGASIVRCGLSCLVDLNSDLYRLCGSLHGTDTFWAWKLS